MRRQDARGRRGAVGRGGALGRGALGRKRVLSRRPVLGRKGAPGRAGRRRRCGPPGSRDRRRHRRRRYRGRRRAGPDGRGFLGREGTGPRGGPGGWSRSVEASGRRARGHPRRRRRDGRLVTDAGAGRPPVGVPLGRSRTTGPEGRPSSTSSTGRTAGGAGIAGGAGTARGGRTPRGGRTAGRGRTPRGGWISEGGWSGGAGRSGRSCRAGGDGGIGITGDRQAGGPTGQSRRCGGRTVGRGAGGRGAGGRGIGTGRTAGRLAGVGVPPGGLSSPGRFGPAAPGHGGRVDDHGRPFEAPRPDRRVDRFHAGDRRLVVVAVHHDLPTRSSRDTAEHRQPVPSWEAPRNDSERVTR